MKNYLQIIVGYKKLILAIVLICGILSFLGAKISPTTYTLSTLLTIHRVNREKTADFQYDNYYAIQATEFVGNTVVGLLQSPEVILEIYKEAKISSENIDPLRDVKKFRPKQLSSHLVKVKIVEANEGIARSLAEAMVKVVNEKIKKLEMNSSKQNSFEVEASPFVISTNKYNPFFVAVLGIFGGLFLGVALAFLFEYFKEEKQVKNL